MVSYFDLIAVVILPSATFGIGMLYQEKKTKKNNMREKASSINEKTISMLKNKINELAVHISGKTFIEYNDHQSKPVLKLVPNYFIDATKHSDIFRIKSNEITLVYKEDKILKECMSVVLPELNYYYTCTCKLETVINSVFSSKPPNSFIQGLKEIYIKKYGIQKTHDLRLNEKDLFALYFLSMTGSTNAYKSGTSFVIDLLSTHFDDLQSLAFNNLETKDNAVEIKHEIMLIVATLNDAHYQLQELHERWQNKYIF